MLTVIPFRRRCVDAEWMDDNPDPGHGSAAIGFVFSESRIDRATIDGGHREDGIDPPASFIGRSTIRGAGSPDTGVP